VGCLTMIRRAGPGLAALFFVWMAGCAAGEDRSPAEMLSIVSAGLEGVDRYTFRSSTTVRSGGIDLQELESYEGEIAGHAVREIRSLSGGDSLAADAAATPAARLAELARSGAEIRYAAEAPDGCVTLHVRLPDDAAAREIRSRLTRRFELAAKKALSEPVAGAGEDYRRTVADETARFRRELENLLSGLQAEATVLVTVDRKTMLPLKLEETVVIRYEAEGKPRTEEWVTRTTLDGFEGKPAS